jgi:hypothetical protein
MPKIANHESQDADSEVSDEDYCNSKNEETNSNSGLVDQEQEIRRLLASENRDVAKWRTLVTVVIMATAALVTYFAHKFLVNGENVDFENAVSDKLDIVAVSCVVSRS